MSVLDKNGRVDTHVEGLGTVRECIDCAALIACGPTRCIRCVKEGPPRSPLYKRLIPVRLRHWWNVRKVRKARLLQTREVENG